MIGVHNQDIIDYLNKLGQEEADWIKQLQQEAEEHHVPIMDKQGIALLQQLIRLHKPTKILEIGTAIGYSALRMLEAYPDSSVVTVERDQSMYERATANIELNNQQDNINIIFGDALEVEGDIQQQGPYDMIFIDAAKGQYRHFFDKYAPLLTDKGLIITDNVLFRGLVTNAEEAPKRLQKLVEKIKLYNQWLMENPLYDTTILPVGDGVAISVKK
ncbi:O-methyltransferase [Gracilibacillus sp. S3-1-1]|uniref:O-methyltransferase n=1 Tax=Gracilibacillus pellucidus TaxID=3095368 RepID=A0ACC6M4I8_9BACI|nr:O-methyltransferase [Gracilibacillus sp. S3-1-1]MDX8045885.1 O-methyltransferase [Gracilibacillus sp. S3-1-1]